MQEHVLSLNDFGMPKVFPATDTAYVLIIRLLLLDPGKYQSHPTMGVGIRTRYRDNNDIDFMHALQTDITNQINTFLPSLNMVDIKLSNKDHVLGIQINTVDGVYALAYNADTDVMDAAATYVLEDL